MNGCKRIYPLVKSIFDKTMALLMLIGLSPLLFFLAVWIKCSSKGPILFTQERLGQNGRIFRIYKFRTMVDNAISMGTGLRTDAKDPRVTKVGRFLRKTSLDELPQLLNILKGEMSFIGPRPPVPYHPYLYENYSETQKKRFLVKPGITGYAQVVYRTNASWEERIEKDVHYVENRSFWFDLKITIWTFAALVSRKNVFPDEKRIQQIDDELKK